MVYVDSLSPCVPNKEWKWTESCHLFADTLEELHEFAAKIGMRRTWFQDKKYKHYDLTATRRKKAVKMGAIEVDRRTAIQILRKTNATTDD